MAGNSCRNYAVHIQRHWLRSADDGESEVGQNQHAGGEPNERRNMDKYDIEQVNWITDDDPKTEETAPRK
ncbi:hypothetical protein GCM10007276_04660 [Agaricicola taiwanensis]|uniref:Uncharacterized protein n=1 Tax=Agaricicola taiwanensis TaxID=591372 RepID=A0A8J2YCF3_9RHOB|nr:hypothetical protein [Agaricicola taiwanensis]GGE30515.1 hypothetical protein GCM10007276_04660 [Agaricicola taiwanensis]